MHQERDNSTAQTTYAAATYYVARALYEQNKAIIQLLREKKK